MSNTVIVVALRTQHENLGDWLIIKCLIETISDAHEILLDIDEVPEPFYRPLLNSRVSILQDVCDATSCRTIKFLQWARKQPLSVGVVMSPGHHGDIRPLRFQLRWAAQCAGCLLFNSFGVRCYRFGASFEALGRLAYLATRLYTRSNSLLLRDRKFGDTFATANDLIILRKLAPASEAPSVSAPPPALKRLLVSVRNDRGTEEERQLLLEEWCGIVSGLLSQTSLPLTLAYQVDRDEGCARALRSKLLSEGMAAEAPVLKIDQSNFESSYSEDALVVSNRLHVALTSLAHGSCGIALVSPQRDQKVIEAFDALGLADRCVPLDAEAPLILQTLVAKWGSHSLAKTDQMLKQAAANLRNTILQEIESAKPSTGAHQSPTRRNAVRLEHRCHRKN